MAQDDVKPYLARIKDWKVKNMVRNYLLARRDFKSYQQSSAKGMSLAFAAMKEIGDRLYEVKEDHHLLYKRVVDPNKNKFEDARKFTPNKIEIDFMNNVGLIFHKILVARELKYVMEHYVEESETFLRNQESLHSNLQKIDLLFDEGLEIVKSFILSQPDNILLLTLLLDDTEKTSRHFGKNTAEIIRQFGNGRSLGDLYYRVGKYYLYCGRREHAKRMFKSAVKVDAQHRKAMVYLRRLK